MIEAEQRLPQIRSDFRDCFSAENEAQRETFLESLLRHRDAEGVLRVAFEEFERHGNDDRLVLAGVVLDALGAQSIPVLEKLAKKKSPETEYFVETAVHLAACHLNVAQSLSLLRQIALNPSDGVRERLASALTDAPFDYRRGGSVVARLADRHAKVIRRPGERGA